MKYSCRWIFNVYRLRLYWLAEWLTASWQWIATSPSMICIQFFEANLKILCLTSMQVLNRAKRFWHRYLCNAVQTLRLTLFLRQQLRFAIKSILITLILDVAASEAASITDCSSWVQCQGTGLLLVLVKMMINSIRDGITIACSLVTHDCTWLKVCWFSWRDASQGVLKNTSDGKISSNNILRQKIYAYFEKYGSQKIIYKKYPTMKNFVQWDIFW